MMYAQDRQHVPDRVELKGILSEFRDALEEEIDKIKKSGQSSTLLFGGRQIESHGADLWYRFNVEYVPSFPADTPCKLVIGKDQFDVTVISYEENSIVISTKTTLPDTIGKARLENGATVLMERLIKCIEENAEKENPAGKRMLSSDCGVYPVKKIFEYDDLALNTGNTQSQNNAIVSALSSDITYIWGPPGTGKTTVIGQIIDELYKHDRSVLVVSHTNTAVDGAIEKADKTYSKSNQDNDTNYPILRIGTPARPLPDRVLLAQHVAALGKELYEQKAALEKQQAELQHHINEIRPLLAKDVWLKESNLDVIRKALQSIAAHEKEITEIQRRSDAINVSVEREKVAHPEYANYLILSKTLKAKKRDYDTVCGQFYRIEQAISVLPDQIQRAQDEVRKHARYTELRAQEAKYMSVSFLRGEISKVDAQINRLQSSISDLTRQQTAAQQTISDYEKKSSVAKLFAGKSAVTQAQTTLERVRREIPIANGDLRRQQDLKQEYSQQLESLLLLQEQIRAVTPSKTPEYWNAEVNKLQAELSAAQKALPELTTRKNALHEKVRELERQQSQAKSSFDVLSELGRKVRLEQDKLAEVTKLRDKENNACSEQLEKEISFCITFLYKPTSEGISPLFNELSKLFASVKAEMASVDMDAIIKEKEDADQQLVEIFRQLNELKEKMQELEKQAIMSAKIVGATLAKSYLSETLRERKFDTVILDEASMASIPALWCASYLAESSIVIVGDFLQLPPIVMADTPMAQKWLGKDIFYHSGMQERARNKETCPENFVMLNNQFRMESDIADIANMYYGAYGGLLSDDNNDFRVKDREKFYSWYSGKRTKRNVHLIDTESLHAWVRLVKVDAKTLLPEIVFARQPDFAFDGNLTGKHIVCREDVFNDYFMADIHSFKKRLIVYSAFMTEARLSTLLPAFSDAVRAGKQIIVVTKALSDRGKSELAQYQKCEKKLRDIGVSVLHKKGMHEKLIFVDSNAVWIGSLNALSFTGLTGEVMQRHADRELTAEYEKLFDIEHICNAIENTYEQKCPICGDEMIVKESDEGGIYWQCVAGDYSRNVAQQYPLDGILRCKCGAPYVFAMKNEPRWVCSEDSRHYQKMRESDLRLEKMAALIPTKAARSQVNKYFFAKKKEIEAKKKATAPKKTSATKKSLSASEDEDDSKQMKMF